jgi:hypothetical protein
MSKVRSEILRICLRCQAYGSRAKASGEVHLAPEPELLAIPLEQSLQNKSMKPIAQNSSIPGPSIVIKRG